jgi:hypothetical protein
MGYQTNTHVLRASLMEEREGVSEPFVRCSTIRGEGGGDSRTLLLSGGVPVDLGQYRGRGATKPALAALVCRQGVERDSPFTRVFFF